MFDKFSLKGAGFGVFIAALALVGIPNITEYQDASEYMVIQGIGGSLTVFTEQGWHGQWFGTVTKYPRQKRYDFKNENGENTTVRVQFNDGGYADLYGSVLWTMPSDEKSILAIHKDFRSEEGVEKGAVIKSLDSAIFQTGPLMSSTESVSERRGELVQYINDQAERGVYVTRVDERTINEDSKTGGERTVKVVQIVRGEDGQAKRQQGSILKDYNIRLQPIAITRLNYDDTVKKQITDRQKATTAVQLAQANAKKAEQDAITAEEQGKANAAQSRWEQEVIKAREVTKAQQSLEVAVLATKEAEQYKQAEILKGQGEAERKRLVMNADGQLQVKLDAWNKAQEVWAEAFANYKGEMVPSIVMGGSGNQNATGNAQAVMDLIGTKMAKDLALDLSNKK